MVIVALTACNQNGNKPIPFNVSYEKILYEELFKYSKTNKIDSLEALINISNENNYPFFNENDSKYSLELSQKIREYNELYFQNGVLILVFYHEPAGDYPAKIDSVCIEEDFLRITMAKPVLETSNDVESMYVFIIEVEKKDVEGIDRIEMVQILKGELKDYNFI